MAKNIIKPTGADGRELRPIHEMVPDHVRDDAGQGSMSLLKQYIVPPRIKIVQPQAKAPFSELFKEADLVVMPVMKRLWGGYDHQNQVPAFHFVPILFWPEWVSWNPYGSNLPAIRDRSFSRTSEIALKARNPDTRQELCKEYPKHLDGKDAYVKHQEHLNYLILVLGDGEFADLPLIMSFSSGEHRAGTNFNALVQSRRTKSLYGCQFSATVRRRENKVGKWYGIDIDNPAEGSGVDPFVMDRERYEQLGRLHTEYASYMRDDLIQTQYDDEGVVEGTARQEPASAETRF